MNVSRQFKGKFDIDDLVSYGTLGLLEASERFDAKHGANFLTFAHYRIKGAIYDGLRQMGVLRGQNQKRAYINERCANYLRSGAATDFGQPQTLSDNVRDVENAVTGLATILVASFHDLPDEGMNQEEKLVLAQLKTRVEAAIEQLPENQRKLLIAYYYEGKTLEESGAVIGQSKSWASRLHARSIDHLRTLLEGEIKGEPVVNKPTSSLTPTMHRSSRYSL
jgi:RNA polymerase sigma factor for flagellar operon FliA